MLGCQDVIMSRCYNVKMFYRSDAKTLRF